MLLPFLCSDQQKVSSEANVIKEPKQIGKESSDDVTKKSKVKIREEQLTGGGVVGTTQHEGPLRESNATSWSNRTTPRADHFTNGEQKGSTHHFEEEGAKFTFEDGKILIINARTRY